MHFKPISIIKNSILLGVSVVACIAAIEVFLRLFPNFMPEEAQLRIHWQGLNDRQPTSQAHPYIGFVYPPHHKGELRRGKEFGFTYTTDENGFRNPSPWPAQAEIVAVGDSMVFGYGVDDDKAWVKRLADSLPLSRVINLGLIGAAPQQYFRIYETFGVALRPKVVLFGLFLGNDLYDAGMFDRWLKAGSPGNYDVWRYFGGRIPVNPEDGRRLGLRDAIRQSYLLTFLRESRRRARSAFSGRTMHFPDDSELQLAPALLTDDAARARPDHPAFRMVMEAVERTRELAQSNGGRLVVLLIPTKVEVYLPLLGEPTPELIQPFVAAFEERGIPYLDLTPPLQAHARNDERFYYKIDGHPNADGYRVIANAVLEHLKSSAERYQLSDWQ